GLQPPGVAAVLRLVDAVVGAGPGRHEISHIGADTLDVAELHRLGAGDLVRDPGAPAIERPGERTAARAGPDHRRVHRADGEETLGGARLLRRYRRRARRASRRRRRRQEWRALLRSAAQACGDYDRRSDAMTVRHH